MKISFYILLATLFCNCGNSNPKTKTENSGKKTEVPASITETTGGIIGNFDISFEDEYGLCVANLKTEKKTLIDEHGTEGNISRDGKQIVYTKDKIIYVKDFVTGTERKINTSWTSNYSPVWSSDNNHIAFYGYYNSENFIAVIGKDGKGLTVISKNQDMFQGPQWTSDGKGLIFNDRRTLYIYDLSGNCKKKYNIYDLTSGYLAPFPQFALTPDERYLVFATKPDPDMTSERELVVATDLQTMKTKALIPRKMFGNRPFVDDAGNIYFNGDYNNEKHAIYKVTIRDTVPKIVLKEVNNFTIKNNVKVASPITLNSCVNCPDIPANAPPLYKEETQ
jgi:hypothetical protein